MIARIFLVATGLLLCAALAFAEEDEGYVLLPNEDGISWYFAVETEAGGTPALSWTQLFVKMNQVCHSNGLSHAVETNEQHLCISRNELGCWRWKTEVLYRCVPTTKED